MTALIKEQRELAVTFARARRGIYQLGTGFRKLTKRQRVRYDSTRFEVAKSRNVFGVRNFTAMTPSTNSADVAVMITDIFTVAIRVYSEASRKSGCAFSSTYEQRTTSGSALSQETPSVINATATRRRSGGMEIHGKLDSKRAAEAFPRRIHRNLSPMKF